MSESKKARKDLTAPKLAGQADPTEVPGPMVGGGLGAPQDGTQIRHHSPTAVPGKPMAPIAGARDGTDELNEQAMDRGAGEQPAEPNQELTPIDAQPAPDES